MNRQKNLRGPVTFKDMDDRDFPGGPVVKILSFRYADDTTFMAESEEEVKSLLIKMKEESETKLS